MTGNWTDRLTNLSRQAGPRVFGAGAAFTPEGAAEVMQRLREWERETGQKWAVIAGRELGRSVDELTVGMRANDEGIVRLLDTWLEQRSLRKPARGGMVMTCAAEQLFAGVRFAIDSGGIVLATGGAGTGKTTCLQAICAETPGAIYIRVGTMLLTAKAVLESVGLAMGFQLRGGRAAAARCLENALAGSNRLLVVDEIHKLVGRRSDEALHALRDLADVTGIPMLWVGMPAIAQYIRSGRNGYEALDQLHSRIGLWIDLDEAARQSGHDPSGPRLASIEDVRRFLACRQLRITPDGERWLLALVNTPGAGAFRTLEKLLALAEKLAADKPITADVLRGLQAMRLGTGAAEIMENRMAIPAPRAVSA